MVQGGGKFECKGSKLSILSTIFLSDSSQPSLIVYTSFKTANCPIKLSYIPTKEVKDVKKITMYSVQQKNRASFSMQTDN